MTSGARTTLSLLSGGSTDEPCANRTPRVRSDEQKLRISQRLRRLPGCAAVINHLSIEGAEGSRLSAESPVVSAAPRAVPSAPQPLKQTVVTRTDSTKQTISSDSAWCVQVTGGDTKNTVYSYSAANGLKQGACSGSSN